MDLSGISNMVADNNILIAVVLLFGFLTWKFIIEPIANEDEPIPEIE